MHQPATRHDTPSCGLIARCRRLRCLSRGNSARFARVGSTRPHRWKARWDAAEPLTCANLPVGRPGKPPAHAGRATRPAALRRRPRSRGGHPPYRTRCTSCAPRYARRGGWPPRFAQRRRGLRPPNIGRDLGVAQVGVTSVGSLSRSDIRSPTLPIVRLPLAARVSLALDVSAPGLSPPLRGTPLRLHRSKNRSRNESTSNRGSAIKDQGSLRATRASHSGLPWPTERLLALALAGAIAVGASHSGRKASGQGCMRDFDPSAYP